MYHISTTDKPPLGYLKSLAEQCMSDGIRIADATQLRKRLSEDAEAARKNLSTNYGIMNPDSPKQVIQALQSLNDSEVEAACTLYDYVNGEKVAKWTSNAKALRKLNILGYDISKQLTIYRRASRYLSYAEKFTQKRDKDGFVHPTVSYGMTNRINYSEPDLMNIPKMILWDLVQPRHPGNKVYSIDIKNQEPWILINMLGITQLMILLEGSEDGLYVEVFRYWFGYWPEKEELNAFKRCWNALTYGGSKQTVYEYCNELDGDAIYKEFKQIEELKKYQEACRKMGFGNKREVETVFGTSILCDKPKGMALSRQIMDAKIQGTGVDILSLLCYHFFKCVEEAGFEGFMTILYTRHDEIVVEVDYAVSEMMGDEWVRDFLQDTFEHQIDDWVPFRVEVKEAMPIQLEYDTEDDEE